MIPISKPSIGLKEVLKVAQTVSSGWVSRGNCVRQFEEQFADYIGCKHASAVSSGTAALHLALRALGIGPGDEVIVPNLTYVATANAVLYCGATPVLVDSPINIDAKFITQKTKAIIAVHLFGLPCNLEHLKTLCETHKLFLIEDCAQAIGTPNICKGDISTFSFFGNKVITTGEGGMVVTNDKDIKNRVDYLRNQACDIGYYHSELGYNYRMPNINAALGIAQLSRIKSFIQKRLSLSCYYAKLISHIPDVYFLGIPIWLFPIRLLNEKESFKRNMRLNGVDVRTMFTPLNQMPMFRNAKFFDMYKNKSVFRYNKRLYMLPLYPDLRRSQVRYICECIERVLEQ